MGLHGYVTKVGDLWDPTSNSPKIGDLVVSEYQPWGVLPVFMAPPDASALAALVQASLVQDVPYGCAGESCPCPGMRKLGKQISRPLVDIR